MDSQIELAFQKKKKKYNNENTSFLFINNMAYF